MEQPDNPIINCSPAKFLVGCFGAALVLLGIGQWYAFPVWLLALEILLTIFALFILGSCRWRLDKNAITYGAVLVVAATFRSIWWESSALRQSLQTEGIGVLWPFFHRNFLTLHGLNALVHADTLLFILGLTLFVAVITQTRLLETISFAILRKNRGRLAPTIALIAALVAAASGILDGVSMIGIMIRTIVIVLFLSKIRDEEIVFTVVISTVVTTVCGMWLAYGEPPNLIMKANLHPYLDNAFFLRYCLPVALASFIVVAGNISWRMKGRVVELDKLDLLERHVADVRFLQAMRHGKVLDQIELVREHEALLGSRLEDVSRDLHRGMSLGESLVRAGVAAGTRQQLLGIFVHEDVSGTLDRHYVSLVAGDARSQDESVRELERILGDIQRRRTRAQKAAILSFLPFVGCLVAHTVNHGFPLFPASFAGFAVALLGIYVFPEMRRLALREAKHEFAEYLFLIPLFFSITLLQKAGFFEQVGQFLVWSIKTAGVTQVALSQFLGATFLSALLDNNVVADFGGRALQGIEVRFIHLFALSQIAGYAAGGCWTHIGSAQSVVAYAFVRKEINEQFTPFQWIRMMTPILIEIILLVSLIIYIESRLLAFLG